MTYAYRCAICAGEPRWAITRRGDAVSSWACDEHLPAELDTLQRDYEVTELVVLLYPKLLEVAEINRTLRQIAEESS